MREKNIIGELLLEDTPVVFGPKSNISEIICVECLSSLNDQNDLKCAKCQMPKCQHCPNDFHSEVECRMLRTFLENSGRETWPESEIISVLKILAPLRLLMTQLENASVKCRLEYLVSMS